MTDQEFSAWAQSSTKHPVLLVEITHKDGTVYLSDQFYATSAGETPEHTSYDVCLKETVLLERALNQESLNALRVFNDGSLDEWVSFAWTDHNIEVFIGDRSWVKSDFRKQYSGKIESFLQLSPSVFEFKSRLATSVSQENIYQLHATVMAGTHNNYFATYVGNNTEGKRIYMIAMRDQFDKNDVSVRFNGYSVTITWVGYLADTDAFYINEYPTTAGQVQFDCVAYKKKFKEFFLYMCSEFEQPLNVANLSDYPFDPDIAFYITESMTFSEFLYLSLDTVGALLWVNDTGEIELHRKELPEVVDSEKIISRVTQQDKPTINTITTEHPVSLIQVKNSPVDFTSIPTPKVFAYNSLDLSYPYRVLSMRSYATNIYSTGNYTQTEARRLADLLAVTRRTYSVTINRITPELFIGAIVNIHSPKDRWEENGQGINALVVGFTQSFTKNTSELIVWR